VREQELLLQTVSQEELAGEGGEVGGQDDGDGSGGGDAARGREGRAGVGGGAAREKVEACERKLKILTDKLQKARRKALLAKIRVKVKEIKEGLKNEVGLW
jgi:hypothetical protein